MNHQGHNQSPIVTKQYVVVLFGLILFSLVFVLWRQYSAIERNISFRSAIAIQMAHISSLRKNGPLPVSDASYIQDWMTFDYINSIFALPSDYLKNSLAIQDPQYPHTSIVRYARETKLDEGHFTQAVITSVGSYAPQ